MEPTNIATVSREEAARLLQVSVRTIDRWFPPGSAGRYAAAPAGAEYARPRVEIERRLIEARMPLPGGETNAER